MVQTDYDEKKCTEEAFKQRALDEIKAGNLKFVSRQDKRRKIREFVKVGLQTKEEYFKKAYRTFLCWMITQNWRKIFLSLVIYPR